MLAQRALQILVFGASQAARERLRLLPLAVDGMWGLAVGSVWFELLVWQVELPMELVSKPPGS